MNIPKVNSERWLSLEDLEGEVWKDIHGYTGLYMISNYGRVKALEKHVHIGNYKHKYKEIIKREYFVRNGYLCVHLSKERKRKAFYVHRLVALAFLKNQSNLPQINHKNEIKTDNYVDNLEFCDSKYNSNYGTHIERYSSKQRIQVSAYDFLGNKMRTFRSFSEASSVLNIPESNISQAVCGKYETAGGYVWRKGSASKIDVTIKKYRTFWVNQYSLDGTYIATYSSATDAERKTGVTSCAIIRCCKGLYNQSKGYRWSYYGSEPFQLKEDKSKVPVAQYTIDGMLIGVFPSMKDAAASVNGSGSGIRLCVIGKNKTAYGYKWKKA